MKRLALLTLLVVGCQQSNPETDRLEAGSQAVIVRDSWSEPYVKANREAQLDPDRVFVDTHKPNSIGATDRSVAIGTRVTVVRDDGLVKDIIRLVEIRIMEGSEADAVASIYRSRLRPLPK